MRRMIPQHVYPPEARITGSAVCRNFFYCNVIPRISDRTDKREHIPEHASDPFLFRTGLSEWVEPEVQVPIFGLTQHGGAGKNLEEEKDYRLVDQVDQQRVPPEQRKRSGK
jgi:hypothetical protein